MKKQLQFLLVIVMFQLVLSVWGQNKPLNPWKIRKKADTLAASVQANRDALAEAAAEHGISEDERLELRDHLWKPIARSFPFMTGQMEHILNDNSDMQIEEFLNPASDAKMALYILDKKLESIGKEEQEIRNRRKAAMELGGEERELALLKLFEDAVVLEHRYELALEKLEQYPALGRAMDAFFKAYPEQYENQEALRSAYEQFGKELDDLRKALKGHKPGSLEKVEGFADLQRKLLLQHPAVDFEDLLLIRREAPSIHPANASKAGDPYGLPQNWLGNSNIRKNTWDNEIVKINITKKNPELESVFKPENDYFVSDVDLHWDGERMLFSSIGKNNQWQVHEMLLESGEIREIIPDCIAEHDNYDPCYLPDGRILFTSTAIQQGVPCVSGNSHVANLFIMDQDGKNVRRLGYDQDHNWCPTVMNDGRVLYTRWEYSDTPHYFTRLLFTMNPDGTRQMAYYGSNSYWPNSMFYARPIPGKQDQFAAIVSGHHGVARMGELILFDRSRGDFEADGVVQRIGDYGKPVEPIIRDQLVNDSWPKFLHPWPLNDELFLVSAKPSYTANWGVYLVDIYDNMVCLMEERDQVFFEPIPLASRPVPPIIPDKVNLESDEATVYLTDIYKGPGLKDVPRGTVKELRIFAFHYGFHRLANHYYIGLDGPWDVHRILGTVPVEGDGSAAFKIPANTPIALQPLDEEGKAIQVMRSWLTAMPGEKLSCVGCHERDLVSASERPMAFTRKPSEIEPWYGPARGYSFERDLQPVLDKHCIRCHDGTESKSGKKIPDLRDVEKNSGGMKKFRNIEFPPAYGTLVSYVRRPSPESDYRLLKPYEYHADTSALVQMLQGGHHGVELDAESWDRLVTWIDLNVPCYGTWGEVREINGNQNEERKRLAECAEGGMKDFEMIPELDVQLTGAPLESADNGFRPANIDFALLKNENKILEEKTFSIPLSDGDALKIDMVKVPAGTLPDGRPTKAFWISKNEITNAQYQAFAPSHDSGYFNIAGKDQSSRGKPMNEQRQPVVRLTWKDAVAFTEYLSTQSGQSFRLPTENEWIYACVVGNDNAIWFDPAEADQYMNCADKTMANQSGKHGPRWRLGDQDLDDRTLETAAVGKFESNPWGLHDMLGNAAEWTSSEGKEGRKIVKGGSFYDLPRNCTPAWRTAYLPWQPVFNVGLRVVCVDDGSIEIVKE